MVLIRFVLSFTKVLIKNHKIRTKHRPARRVVPARIGITHPFNNINYPCMLNNITLGFLIHGFWDGRESSMLEVWAAPAAPKTIPKGLIISFRG